MHAKSAEMNCWQKNMLVYDTCIPRSLNLALNPFFIFVSSQFMKTIHLHVERLKTSKALRLLSIYKPLLYKNKIHVYLFDSFTLLYNVMDLSHQMLQGYK